MVDKSGQLKDYYNSEIVFFKEHNADQYFQTGLKYYNDGNYTKAFIQSLKSLKMVSKAASLLLNKRLISF